MKNKRISGAITLVLTCLLLVGAALGITAAAASTGATQVEIAYKNVSYAGAPRLVLYTDTNKPLAANQEVRMLFWNSAVEVYNEKTADYSRTEESRVIIDGKQHSVFMADGVSPAELRKAVYVRPVIVEIAEDGSETVTAFGELLRYSVFEYAVDMFAARDGAAADQNAMYSQLLDFAAAVQKVLYTNANGDYVINGEVVTEKEFEAHTGGWVDAYYIAEVERYLVDPSTKEQVFSGESYRLYSRTPGVSMSAEEFITIGENTYMFAGFKTAAGGVVQQSLISDDKVSVTATPERSLNVTAETDGIGVTYFREVYSEPVGKYFNFDDGADRSSFTSDANYWNQYGVTNGSSSVFNGDMSTVTTTTIYEYYLVVGGQEYEIPSFYTADGSIMTTFGTNYKYVAINTAKSGKDMIVTGTYSTYKSNNPDAQVVFFNVIDNADLNKAGSETITYCEEAEVSIKRKAITVYNKGYVQICDDPASVDGTAPVNKVINLTKHVFDLSNPSKIIVNAGNAFSSSLSAGVIPYIGQVTSSGGTAISNNSVTFVNQSPTTYYNGGEYPTHIFECDLYVDSNTTSTLSEIYWYCGSSVIWAFNINKVASTGDIYFGIKEGPGSTTANIYNANGGSMGAKVIAGSNGSTTAGVSMKDGEWYKVRMEYVAEANDRVTIKTYIDGQLCSFIRSAAHGNSSGYYADDYFTKIEFRNNNGTRDTRYYIDNVYLASIGDTEKETVAFDDGRPSYWGKGEYYEQAQSFPSGFKTGGNKHTIIKDLDDKGNPVIVIDKETGEEVENTVMHMLKSDGSGGGTTNFSSVEKNGNIYVFETDFKIVGTDNLTSWLAKMQFIANPEGGDANEFMMLCFSCREDASGTYWTLSQLDTIIKDSNGNAFKGMLGKWYNLHFEYDPITNNGDIYINGEFFASRTMSQSGSIKEDTKFAGVGMNVRAYPQGTVYTEIIFDNTIATTINTDNIGAGSYFDQSEHYDDYADSEGITVETDENGKYLNITGATIIDAPGSNSGHTYVYETDIKWNSVGKAAETLDIMSLAMYNGENAIFEIVGYTEKGKEGLFLKSGDIAFGKLTQGYWSNLRVVITPLEPEQREVEYTDEEGNTYKETKTAYGADIEVFINGGSVWAETIESINEELVFIPNGRFDSVKLDVNCTNNGDSLMIDNTFVDARFVDNFGSGSNAPDSDGFEKDENATGDGYIVGGVYAPAVKNENITQLDTVVKFNWNGVFGLAEYTSDVAEISVVDSKGNTLSTIKINIDRQDKLLHLGEKVLELDKYYTIKISYMDGSPAYSLYIAPADGSERAYITTVTGNISGFAGVYITPCEDSEVFVDKNGAASGSQDVNEKYTINSNGTTGTTYLFKTDFLWNIISDEYAYSNGDVVTLEFVDADGAVFLTLYGVVRENDDSYSLVLSDKVELDGNCYVALEKNVNYQLEVRIEGGKYSVTVDGKKVAFDDAAYSASFGGVNVIENDYTINVNIDDYYATAFDGYANDRIEFVTSGSTGSVYGFNATVTVNYGIVGGAAAGAIEFVNLRGDVVLAIDLVINGSKVDCYVGDKLVGTISKGTAYNMTVKVTGGVCTVGLVAVGEKSGTTLTAKVDMPDSVRYVSVSANNGVSVLLTEAGAYTTGEHGRADGITGDSVSVNNTESIGSAYTFETDIRVYWNGIFAADIQSGKIFDIKLVDQLGNTFLTIYGMVDESDPIYAMLSLSEDVSASFYRLPLGVWDNINIVMKDGKATITIGDKERASLNLEMPYSFVKAVVTAYGDSIVDVDNSYLDSSIENFKGKGDNKDSAIDNYLTSVENGEIEFDSALSEVDPDDEFTDAYIDVTKSGITMSKQTADAKNSMIFNYSGVYRPLFVFETDLFWDGTVWGAVNGTSDVFTAISILGTKYVDGEEVDVVLATIYAVGVCYADPVAPDVQYLALYTSLEEGSEPVAFVRQDLWYNIRLTYNAENGDIGVYLNNAEVAVINGEAGDDVSFKGAEIALGNGVYDVIIKLQKTYIGAKKN